MNEGQFEEILFRLRNLEALIIAGGKKPKVVKEAKLGHYHGAVLEIMTDGRTWNAYSLTPELEKRGFEPKYPSLCACLSKLTKKGKIERVAKNTYIMKRI
jgi:hypothetical protein